MSLRFCIVSFADVQASFADVKRRLHATTTREAREGLRIHSVIPGRLEEANPESRDSGSGADAPFRNDKVLPRKQERRHEMLTPFV